MAIAKTVIRFANINETIQMTGDRNAADIKAQFQPYYAFLANATFTETVSGDTKTITFSEQMGTKGR